MWNKHGIAKDYSSLKGAEYGTDSHLSLRISKQL